MIDFNMSYAYVAALVFFSLGAMLAGVDQTPFEQQWKWSAGARGWLRYYPTAMGVIVLVVLVTSFQMLSASSSYKTAYTKAADFGLRSNERAAL